MSLVTIVSLSLDEFKEYYYGDERTTNCSIIDSVIVPLIERLCHNKWLILTRNSV